ncbi:ArsR/SmtB family transcription factor [Streptomyces sp. NPDC057592]|uniref:ArsR/SmtB family transcription factor n=1 Tax=unclassified Streptomyces TaxID=2593676 RepID=UPI0036C83E92
MLTSVDPDLIRVLGDPLRLQIVTLLARETLCTTHLVEETGAKQTNLSNHLKVLREAGVAQATGQIRKPEGAAAQRADVVPRMFLSPRS